MLNKKLFLLKDKGKCLRLIKLFSRSFYKEQTILLHFGIFFLAKTKNIYILQIRIVCAYNCIYWYGNLRFCRERMVLKGKAGNIIRTHTV